MKYPKVSIIIPCYNVERFLSRCIESLVNCDYSNKELIFVNDGSTDGTLEILLKASADYENIIVIDKSNGGVASARNEGLSRASGEYVMFPDPDDYVLKDYISIPLQSIHYENIDMVLFGFTANWSKDNSSDIFPIEPYYLQSNREILDTFFPRFLGLSLELMDNYLRGGAFTKERETGQVWRWIYRKSILDDNAIRFIPGIANEDTIFNAECLLRANSLMAIQKMLYVYEPRPEGLMNTNNQIDKYLRNKYDFLAQRKRLGCIYEEITGKEAISLYGGSLIMSAIQLGLTLEGADAYKNFKDYLQLSEVRMAIKKVRLHTGNLKASIPILLLKANLSKTLFFIFKFVKKLGVKIKY